MKKNEGSIDADDALMLIGAMLVRLSPVDQISYVGALLTQVLTRMGQDVPLEHLDETRKFLATVERDFSKVFEIVQTVEPRAWGHEIIGFLKRGYSNNRPS